MADGQDNPGIRVPPPLIYLLALLLGLLLNIRLHVPFLSREVACILLRWPLMVGEMALAGRVARAGPSPPGLTRKRMGPNVATPSLSQPSEERGTRSLTGYPRIPFGASVTCYWSGERRRIEETSSLL
jgi:hypothetical protein